VTEESFGSLVKFYFDTSFDITTEKRTPNGQPASMVAGSQIIRVTIRPRVIETQPEKIIAVE